MLPGFRLGPLRHAPRRITLSGRRHFRPRNRYCRRGMPRRLALRGRRDVTGGWQETLACLRGVRGRRPGPAPGDGHNEAGEQREGRDDQRRRNARLGRRPGACRGNAPQCLRGRPDRSCGAPRQGRCRLHGHDLGRTARSHRRLAGGAGPFPGSIGRRIPRRGRPARPRAAAATRCHLGDGCHLACHRRRGAHSSGDPAGPALVVLAARGLGALGRRVTHCRGSGRPSGCACAALRGLWRSPPRRRCIMPRSSPRPSLSRSWPSRQRRPGRAARRGGLCRLGGAMTLPGPGLGPGSEVWLMPVIYVPWAFPAGSVRSQSPGLPWRAGSLFAIGGDEGRPPTVGLAELIAWARSRKTGAARRSS